MQDLLKDEERFKDARTKNAYQITPNKTVAQKGLDWVVVMPPVQDLEQIASEIIKVHEKLYKIYKQS